MEVEVFTRPAEADEWFDHWVEECWNWFVELGVNPENKRRFDNPEGDHARYSTGKKRDFNAFEEYLAERIKGAWRHTTSAPRRWLRTSYCH